MLSLLGSGLGSHLAVIASVSFLGDSLTAGLPSVRLPRVGCRSFVRDASAGAEHAVTRCCFLWWSPAAVKRTFSGEGRQLESSQWCPSCRARARSLGVVVAAGAHFTFQVITCLLHSLNPVSSPVVPDSASGISFC